MPSYAADVSMVTIVRIMVSFLTRLACVARRKSDQAFGKTVRGLCLREAGERGLAVASGVSPHELSLQDSGRQLDLPGSACRSLMRGSVGTGGRGVAPIEWAKGQLSDVPEGLQPVAGGRAERAPPDPRPA